MKKGKVFPHRGGPNYQRTHYDMLAVKQELEYRMQVLEKLASDTTFQTIGLLMLIRSIPVIGNIIIKLMERNIKQYQRIVQRQSVKQYKERKNG